MQYIIWNVFWHETRSHIHIRLYKGSRKYADDRKNYRGISLLPVITKLFERVVLNRIKTWIVNSNIAFPSSNQNAYQQSMCSLFASFGVQECVNYNTERGSKVAICLLDSSNAFDTVWHAGLFYKLHELGIKGKTWRVLYNSYQGMVSNVVSDGRLSSDINVKRSVRQGSILGPWYYMLFIHELAQSLIKSNTCAKVGQVACGAILQADDIALVTLTLNGLQTLVSLCEEYSKLWRFSYNPIKSKVIIFGESNRNIRSGNDHFAVKLYDEEIEKVSSCIHVGIALNSSKYTATRTNNAISKMRGGLMSIIGHGVKLPELSCITAVKLYKSIVLPSSLYGSELWYRLTRNDITKLEVAHRFCLKYIQSFPKRTRTIIVHTMSKCSSIESYIDRKKLLFFGRLCRLDSSKLAKRVFIERVYLPNSNARRTSVMDLLMIFTELQVNIVFCSILMILLLTHFFQARNHGVVWSMLLFVVLKNAF